MQSTRKNGSGDSAITLSRVHPKIFLAPKQALRVWLYLVCLGEPEVKTTPGELHENLRKSGIRISRRAMNNALGGLEYTNMISVDRRGHMMTIETGVSNGS
jgi:hypothetical protein